MNNSNLEKASRYELRSQCTTLTSDWQLKTCSHHIMTLLSEIQTLATSYIKDSMARAMPLDGHQSA